MNSTTFSGKRFLSMLLIVAMLMGLMPGSVFATGGEQTTTVAESTEAPQKENPTEEEVPVAVPEEVPPAQVNPSAEGDVASVTTSGGETTTYDNLSDAVRFARANSESTVKLLQNVTLDSGITVYDGTFTLDLNGKAWTCTGSTPLYIESASVTLTDSSETRSGIMDAVSAGKSVVYAGSQSVLTINGGTYTSEENISINLSGTAQLTINDGAFHGGDSAVFMSYGYAPAVPPVIAGGTFTHGSEGSDLTLTHDLSTMEALCVSLQGGTFPGGFSIAGTGNNLTLNRQLAAGYGFYTEDGTLLTLPDGAQSTGGETVTVKRIVMATVTTTGGETTVYDSFDAAMEYARSQPGSTVKLMQNATGKQTQIAVPMTLDLNGFTLDMGKNNLDIGAAFSPNTPHLTITDTSEGKTGKITSAFSSTIYCGYRVDQAPGKVTILGGSIVNTYDADRCSAIKVADVGVLEILGGSVQGMQNDILVDNASTDFTGAVTISGGTFPGGLQLKLNGSKASTENTLNDLLAEGSAFFSEAGTQVTVAEDALTTGNETVMVGKLSDCEATVSVGETTTTYLNADKALTAAKAAVASGETYQTVTLKLLKDVTITDTLLDGITLDLNGYTLTAAEGSNFAVSSGYTTVIRDSSAEQTGLLRSTLESGITMFVGGTLTIQGGKIIAAWRSSAMRVSGVANIEGGIFMGKVETNNTQSVINISGGTFHYTVSRYYGGTINISGGTFHAANDVEDSDKAGALTITGGAFVGGIMETGYRDVFTYLPAGYVFTDENGYVVTGEDVESTTVTVKNCVATVTAGGVSTVHDSFNAAMDYALTQNDATVKLMQNTTGKYVQITCPVTLDLNGYTLDMGNKNLAVGHYEEGYTPHLTITDTSADQTGKVTGSYHYTIYCGWAESAGKATILGGTIVNTYDYRNASAIRLRQGSALEIRGGTIQGVNQDVYFDNIDEDFPGAVDIFGGTFPGGLQMKVGSSAYTSTENDVFDLLAEGYGFFSEAGIQVTVAEDALTTGNETVTVGKLSDCEASVTVGETTTVYMNLTDAVTAAQASNGSTLKLLKDIVRGHGSIKIQSGTFTFDLNGKTVSYSGYGNGMFSLSNCNLTVTDSSEAQTGTFDMDCTSNSGCNIFWFRDSGSMEILGGHFKGRLIQNTSRFPLEIKGGTFYGDTHKNGCDIADTGGFPMNVIITGGTFIGGLQIESSKNVTVDQIMGDGYGFAEVGTNVYIPDTTYSGATSTGTQDVYVSNIVATVTAGGVSTVYDSFSAAMGYAISRPGAVVKLMQDCATTSDDYYGYLIKNAELELDLNGKTLSTTGSEYALYTSGNTRLVIRDSSTEQTGAITKRIYLKGEIYGGSYQGVICDDDLTIYGGTFGGDRAVSVTYHSYNLTVYGGEFNGAACDLYFGFSVGDYVGKTAFYGGTFPGGLQITVGGQQYIDSAPTAAQILGEGCAYFSEAGTVVTVAEDALTTGTETVTVGKLADCEATVTVGETTTTYLTVDHALAAVNAAVATGSYTYDQITLKLLKDCGFSDESVNEEYGQIELNGFTLDLNGYLLKAHENHRFVGFTIEQGYTTAIRDSGEAGTGKLQPIDNFVVVYGTVNVYGGEVVGWGNGRAWNVSGVMNIYGGTYSGPIYAFNTLNVYGGVFTKNNDFWQDGEECEITLYGGTFVNGINEYKNKDVNTYLAPGHVFVDENGRVVTGEALKTTTVTVKNPVAIVTTAGGVTTTYDSLQVAVDYAATQTNSTVKMMQNVDLGKGRLLINGGTFTLDLNGKTLVSAYQFTGGTINFHYQANPNLTIRDSSATETTPGTGAVISNSRQSAVYSQNPDSLTIYGGYFYCGEASAINCAEATLTIYGGTFEAPTTTAVSLGEGALTIYGGTFTGYYALSTSLSSPQYRGYHIYGGTFNGTNADFNIGGNSGTKTPRNFTLHGGTFPGGLTVRDWANYAEKATAVGQLAEGCAYFTEDGTPVFPAADALTTGTETVTVKKQVAMAIALNKEVYYKDDGTIKVTITTQQKELSGWLYIYIDGQKIDQESYSVSGGRQPLTNGKVYTKSLFNINPGDHEIYLQFVPDDTTIAEGQSNTVAFTVEKIPNENLHKHFTTGETKVAYDGTVKAADVKSRYEAGANNFYLAPESYTLTYWQGETQVAEPVNVGTYTVKLTMAENDYYQAATDYEMGTLVIEQAVLTLDMLDYTVPESGTYSGEAFVATATMKSQVTAYGEMKLEYLAEGETGRTTEAPVAPGAYTVYVSVTGGENVMASEVILGRFTIAKANPATEIAIYVNGEISSNAQFEDQIALRAVLSAPAPGAVPTGTFTITAGGREIGTFTLTDGKAEVSLNELGVGTYEIGYTYSGDENYDTASGKLDAELVISPKSVTLTPSGLEQVYDGKSKTITFTNNTEKLGMEDFTVTYYLVNENMGTISKVNRAVSIGRYLYVVELKDEHKANYRFANPITIDGDILPEGTFDNAGFMDIVAGLPEAQEPIYFVEGAVTVYLADGTYSGNTLVNPNNTIPTYTSSNNSVAEVAADGTVTLKRTGTVTIFATSEKEGTTPVRASYTLTIEKKDATITVNGLTTTYGEPFTLTEDLLTITGCQLSDLNLDDLTYTGYTVGQGVGTYYITPAGITSEAYDLTFVAGTLTVQPRAIDAATITVTAASKVYDSTTAAELTATLPEGAILSGDKVTVTVEGAYTAATAGTVEATITALTLEGKDSGNYVLTGTAPTTAQGEIQKATVTFTTESKTFTYDGTAKALDIVAKTNNGLTAEYTVQYNAEPVLPGEYTVTVTLTDTVNYTADVTDLEGKILKIEEAKQQSFTVSGLEDGIRYGDTKQLTAEGAEGTVTFKITEGTAATVTASGELKAIGTGKVVILATSVKEGFEDKTVKVTVTVGKRLITASVESVTDRPYDGTTEVTATVKLNGIINNDTVNVTNVAEIQTPDVGNNKSVSITIGELTGEDASLYELTTETLRGKVNITARAIDASAVTVTAEGKIYDATTAAKLTATLPEGAVLSGDQVTITAEGAYISANAGTTEVTVTALTLGGNDARNYVLTGTAPATATGEIQKATATFTTASKTVSYDGYEKVLEINVRTNNGLTADYTVTYSTADGSNPILPGEYTATVSLADTVNYTADVTGLEGKTLTITAAKQQSFTISGLEDGLRYGDTKTLTAENAEGVVTFKIMEGTAFATIDAKSGELTATGVGKVVIEATSVKEGFEDKTVKVTVTVGKRRITAALESVTDRVYNGSTVVNASVKLENTVSGDDVMVSGVIAEMMTPGVGENKTVSITISGLSGTKADFYELTNTTLRGTVNITPKTVEAITFTVSDKVYDGTTDAEVVNIALAGILGSDQVTAIAKVAFEDANAGENKTIQLVDVALTGADARNYWIADTTAVTVNTPTIHKSMVTVFCPETTTYTYDGTVKAVYVSALANGKAFNGYTVSYTLDGVATEPINVGTYTLVITLNDAVNYELAPYTGKLVIEPATQDEATIEGIPDRVYYGDDFTVTVPGTSGSVSYEITGAATMDENGKVTAKDVGTITIKATITMANYKDQVITRTITAYPRVLTATATAANRTYNGKNEVDVTISLSNVVAGDTVTATAQGQMATSDAGTDKLVYVTGITLSDNVHYTLENTTLQTTVDIARIVISSITATAQDKIYDGTDTATVTITGSSNILSGDEVTITGNGRFASANAGKHTVTVTPTAITGPKAQNYALAQGLTGTTQAEILPATVAFEVGTATFIYDGTPKTVEVTAELGGQAFTGFTISYDVENPTNVGIYTVTVTLNDSQNYVGAPEPFTMEILPADQEQLIIAGMPGVVDYSRVFTLTTNAHEAATVTWSTSDETIATVDENGTVTIVDVDREVTITATATMANYNDRSATVTFTPVAKQVSFQLSDLITTYDGTVQGITVTPSVEGFTDYTVTYTDEQGRVVDPVNAGIYQVEVKTTSNKYAGYTMGTLTIKKGLIAGELTMEGWTYGEEANEPNCNMSVSGLRPEFTYSGTGLKDGQPYGAGQYTLTATFADRNHETLVLTADFEIRKAVLTVTAGDATRAYGEANPAFRLSYSGFVYGEGEEDLLVAPSATTTATTASDVGEYTITVSGGRSENYEFTYVSGKLTIVPAQGTLTITGSSHEVTIGQTMYLQAHLNGFRPNVIWSSSDEDVAVVDENGKVTIVGAGNATITAKLNERNFVADDATFLLETTEKVISLLPKNTVFTYTGTVQSVEFLETEGFIPVVGENVKLTYTLTTGTEATELRNAGTYVAVYEITDPAYAGSGTFTVYMNKAVRTLRPADLEKTYGEANPAFTIDPNGLLGEDVTDAAYIARVNAMFVFTCEANAKSLEGTYPITMALAEGHSLTEDPNYDFVIGSEPGNLIIRSITGSKTCPSAHFTDLDPNAWYHEAVDYVVGNGLMNGVSDTLFAPQSNATRGMIVTILYRLEGEPEMGENVFTDVSDSAWYCKAISWASANDIVLGYGDGTFRPEQAITREEMAVIMYRYAAWKGCDVDVSADLSDYTDAQSVSAWAKEAIAWANATGLIRGRTETTLVPKGTATRVELATILMRLIENVLK